MFNKTLLIDMENRLDPEYVNKLGSTSKEIINIPNNREEIIKNALNTDTMLVSFNVKINKEIMSNSPNLKYIGVLGTNLGNIDTDFAKQKNITVTNIPGYCTDSVAEFIFAAILENIRCLERGKNRARKGNYSESGITALEIKNKEFGIIGLGRIGKQVAQIAKGFGTNVSHYSKTKKPGFNFKEINAILSESDFISINLSHNKETIGFFDEEKINLIKKGAIVVCTVNMETVDIDSLDKRLSKKDMTFILDHSDELSKDELHKLKKHSNCIIYPPIAYISKEAQKNKQEMFLQNITTFLDSN